MQGCARYEVSIIKPVTGRTAQIMPMTMTTMMPDNNPWLHRLFVSNKIKVNKKAMVILLPKI